MITMTYDLAMAAGQDAGERKRHDKGLSAWDVDCWNEAANTFHRLYGCHVLRAMSGGTCPECGKRDAAAHHN